MQHPGPSTRNVQDQNISKWSDNRSTNYAEHAANSAPQPISKWSDYAAYGVVTQRQGQQQQSRWCNTAVIASTQHQGQAASQLHSNWADFDICDTVSSANDIQQCHVQHSGYSDRSWQGHMFSDVASADVDTAFTTCLD